ncbi:hypothetical protein D9M71_792230 [compost metagenome]
MYELSLKGGSLIEFAIVRGDEPPKESDWRILGRVRRTPKNQLKLRIIKKRLAKLRAEK